MRNAIITIAIAAIAYLGYAGYSTEPVTKNCQTKPHHFAYIAHGWMDVGGTTVCEQGRAP